MSRDSYGRRHGQHRRRATAPDPTANQGAYHVTGTWPGRAKPARFRTHELARARGIARKWASQGATAVVESHVGHGRWRVLRTYEPVEVAS